MKILLLCSGGDAPGMNRVIYDIYRAFKDDCFFAYAGFTGLINGQIYPLGDVIDEKLKDEAGTVIKTSRCPEFKQKKPFAAGLKNAQQFDCVVVIGGNGSQNGAKELFQNGVGTIFLPGTIDNDVQGSHYSIGFSTAVKEGVYAVENSFASIRALGQACLYEVMGRECPAIAQAVAKAVGADMVVADKAGLNFDRLEKVILQKYIKSQSACIVVRENIMPIEQIAEKLNKNFGMDLVKTHIVGRTQRGGKPTPQEILMAKKFAAKTIECIKTKQFGVRILADKDGNVAPKKIA